MQQNSVFSSPLLDSEPLLTEPRLTVDSNAGEVGERDRLGVLRIAEQSVAAPEASIELM